jgi:hypothetical protein
VRGRPRNGRGRRAADSARSGGGAWSAVTAPAASERRTRSTTRRLDLPGPARRKDHSNSSIPVVERLAQLSRPPDPLAADRPAADRSGADQPLRADQPTRHTSADPEQNNRSGTHQAIRNRTTSPAPEQPVRNRLTDPEQNNRSGADHSIRSRSIGPAQMSRSGTGQPVGDRSPGPGQISSRSTGPGHIGPSGTNRSRWCPTPSAASPTGSGRHR